jgi:tetrahedral aminopeptidase
VCREYAAGFVDEVYKDVHGNQFFVRNPGCPLRIMLAGHVDEIGLMVNYIDDKGFLSFEAIGGVDPSVLDGQRVVVHGRHGPVHGVIGRKAIHLTDEEERGKPLKMHELWIDIGAKDKDDAESVIMVSDPVTVDVGFVELRNECAVARAFDDRIGAFVVLEAMRLLVGRPIQCTVYCVTTVQEEIGLRGARTSAHSCDPQAGIAVDVAHATDSPLLDMKRYGRFTLGGGPIIHRGSNVNPVVERQIAHVAKEHDIPVQMKATPCGTGTDANAMQLNRDGVATGLIGIPNRYMHSPVEMIHFGDVEQASILIAEWIAALPEDVSFIA